MAYLDSNHEVASVLQVLSAVDSHDSGLVWLGNIGEDEVNHFDKESVIPRLSGVQDQWDDVGPLFGHVQQLSSTPRGELNGVENSGRSDDIGNVRTGGSGTCSQIQDLASWTESKFVETSNDSSGDL